jgi:hypothetical protein
MGNTFKYGVLLGYTSKDSAIGRKLAERTKADGFSYEGVAIERDIRDGG